jgi:hypothetical protein
MMAFESLPPPPSFAGGLEGIGEETEHEDADSMEWFKSEEGDSVSVAEALSLAARRTGWGTFVEAASTTAPRISRTVRRGVEGGSCRKEDPTFCAAAGVTFAVATTGSFFFSSSSSALSY